jgi:hypothetical protein
VDVKPESPRTIELRSFLAYERAGKTRVPWMLLAVAVLCVGGVGALLAALLTR